MGCPIFFFSSFPWTVLNLKYDIQIWMLGEYNNFTEIYSVHISVIQLWNEWHLSSCLDIYPGLDSIWLAFSRHRPLCCAAFWRAFTCALEQSYCSNVSLALAVNELDVELQTPCYMGNSLSFFLPQSGCDCLCVLIKPCHCFFLFHQAEIRG